MVETPSSTPKRGASSSCSQEKRRHTTSEQRAVDSHTDDVDNPNRTQPAIAPRPVLQNPVLRLRQAQDNGSSDLTFRFNNTPACSVHRLNTKAELHALLHNETEHAVATAETWIRQPNAKWIADMARELNPPRRERLAKLHRQLQTSTAPEHDFLNRWADTSDFASAVINFWFEDKSLSDVLARAKELGHTGAEAGCILNGDLIDNTGDLVSELAVSSDVGMDWLKPTVEKMCESTGFVPVFQVCPHNCFEQEQDHMMHVSKIEAREGQGSLNTTWTYIGDSTSRVEIMDSFCEAVDEAVGTCDDVQVNRRLYMIWKFQHYVTSYHQDTHVPPHFTIYNQVSGFSLFHFLPLLVGLYVTYVGRKAASELESVLKELDTISIGSLAVLGPGQLALIRPFGAHGVWVPATALNPEVPPFQVSLIRAAELFVRPVMKSSRQHLMGDGWNNVLAPTARELAQVKSFSSHQRSICKEMGLSKHDWLWLSRKLWEAWYDGDAWSDSEDGDDNRTTLDVR